MAHAQLMSPRMHVHICIRTGKLFSRKLGKEQRPSFIQIVELYKLAKVGQHDLVANAAGWSTLPSGQRHLVANATSWPTLLGG